MSGVNIWSVPWDEIRRRLVDAPPGKLYGVPRGGAIVAGLAGRAVDRIEDADAIVDDIIDSGKTREIYAQYKKPFWALVDRLGRDAVPNAPAGWVVFPWDAAPELDPQQNVVRLLQYIGENPTRDGLKDTPRRVVKALTEMTAGYKQDPATILGRVFEDTHDQLITLDHIEFVSMCEHHMMAFMGQVHVGYIPRPGKGIVGISKLARLVDCFARRLQVQERMTRQVAETIEKHLEPIGVAVVIEARHSCVCARGVGKQSSVMRTSVMLGVFREKADARAEFLSLTGISA